MDLELKQAYKAFLENEKTRFRKIYEKNKDEEELTDLKTIQEQICNKCEVRCRWAKIDLEI
jgi:uncharacterized protein YaaR (DUF327 family)